MHPINADLVVWFGLLWSGVLGAQSCHRQANGQSGGEEPASEQDSYLPKVVTAPKLPEVLHRQNHVICTTISQVCPLLATP